MVLRILIVSYCLMLIILKDANLLLNTCVASQSLPNKLYFWSFPKKGTNIFNKIVLREDIRAAKAYGVEFVRLAPDKFKSNQRDFLLGNADHYQSLVEEDFKKLKAILDMCAEEKMPVVLTMLSLPGSRWKQNNHNKDDLRIWHSKEFQKQAIKFWKDLALKLKNHPAVIGYNILNEPHIEKVFSENVSKVTQEDKNKIRKMLFEFYESVISSIRMIDPDIAIILDSSAYGDPQAFDYFIPHQTKNILYSFHMYEPYAYTNAKMNKGKFIYPGNINGKRCDKNQLQTYLKFVELFQEKFKISSNRILVGEFGGHRTSPGLENYFRDLTDIFIENKWHFAFYAFREDTWDGMDYELGSQKLSWKYWQAIEKGEKPFLLRKDDHLQFKILKKAMNHKH